MMILKFLSFMTTILLVRSESLLKKVTLKSSPTNLQELLDSLHKPEYILPENELTETEKTEEEYVNFPDFKKAQENVFVPPESEYLKYYAHLKNIKGHKRLVPQKVKNSKMSKFWKKSLNSGISPNELRSDFLSHLTENFTGRQFTQNDSAMLDFLIPIPEKGTYAPKPTQNLYKVPLAQSTVYYFPTPDKIEKIWGMELIKSPEENHQTSRTVAHKPYPQYQIVTIKSFATALPVKHQFIAQKTQYFGSNQQPLPTLLPPKSLFEYNAQQPQFPFGLKQPTSPTVQYQPAVEMKQLHHDSRTHQLQDIFDINIGRESQPAPLLFQTNRTISKPIQFSVHRLKLASEMQGSEIVTDKVLFANSTASGDLETMLIKPNYPTIQANIQLCYGTTPNVQFKILGQTKSSMSSYGTSSAVEYPPPTKQKKKIFTIFNIFKKNKQKPTPEEQSHNASLKGKRENRAITLAELYNRLKERSTINENNFMEKEYSLELEDKQPEIYQKRKKRKK